MHRLPPLLALLLVFAPSMAQAQSACGDAVTVEPGDTLNRIADRCGTSLDAILDVNPGIENPNVIAVGQRVDLPSTGERDPIAEERPGREMPRLTPEPAPSPSPEPEGPSYTVRSGDTLAEIAARFGVTVADVLAANDVIDDPARLQIGWVLDIPGITPDAPQRPDRRRRPDYATDVEIEPESGEPGTRVRVEATGFPANARVRVGAGPAASEYEILRTDLRTNARGAVTTTATLPSDAQPRNDWIFVVETADHRTKGRSERFDVRASEAPDDNRPAPGGDRVIVRGQLTDEGVECPAMRGQDGRLYTLAGATGRFEPGDSVRVEGAVADVSFCQQGTTIDVSRLMAWKARAGGDPTDDDGGNLRLVRRVEGTLFRATECPAVRTDGGEVFTLAGDVEGFRAGDRVSVEGTEADLSICQEGATLDVRQIEPAR